MIDTSLTLIYGSLFLNIFANSQTDIVETMEIRNLNKYIGAFKTIITAKKPKIAPDIILFTKLAICLSLYLKDYCFVIDY